MLYREADELNTYLFHEGTAISAYEYMGAHAVTRDGIDGFACGHPGPRPSPWWVISISGTQAPTP